MSGRRDRTATCPGCGSRQRLILGDLVAHYSNGTPMPVTANDYAHMCEWSLGKPDAVRPASAAFVETARRQDREHLERVDVREVVRCAGDCSHDVTGEDWQITNGQSHWHPACWHATRVPGQGDLLELLSVVSHEQPLSDGSSSRDDHNDPTA